MGSAQQVLEISRAVLGDRGRGGYVAVIKIYMDESGTHGGTKKSPPSPIVTVGAYAAQPKKWQSFTKEWNAQKKPIDVYHAVDCANGRGEFKDWPDKDRADFAARVLPIIPKHIPFGLVVGMDLKAFEAAMKPYPHLRERFGTPYTACFHWAVQILIDMIEKHKTNNKIDGAKNETTVKII